jgi:ribosome biogenesis GTPase A
MRQKPTNHEPYWELIERIVKESDLVLEILDARLVELSRNEQVETLIEEAERPMIFVINKSDLVSRSSLKEQVKKLRAKGEVVFVSAKSPKDVKVLLYAIKKAFKKSGKREVVPRGKFDPKPLYREAKGEIVVGVLGYPNVGKSSIINALSHGKKVQVSKKSGTTHGVHWIKATKEIKLIDSPGVIPLKEATENKSSVSTNSNKLVDDEIRYGLIGAKDNERLKNPPLVAHAIIKLFMKDSKKKFEEFYNLEIDEVDAEKIVEEVGLKKGFLVKGGLVDENRTCSVIIRDWQEGKLRL